MEVLNKKYHCNSLLIMKQKKSLLFIFCLDPTNFLSRVFFCCTHEIFKRSANAEDATTKTLSAKGNPSKQLSEVPNATPDDDEAPTGFPWQPNDAGSADELQRQHFGCSPSNERGEEPIGPQTRDVAAQTPHGDKNGRP